MVAGGKSMESIKSIRHVRLWQIYQNSYLSYFLMYNFIIYLGIRALISVYLMNMGLEQVTFIFNFINNTAYNWKME